MSIIASSSVANMVDQQQQMQIAQSFEPKVVSRNDVSTQILVGSYKQGFFSRLSKSDRQILDQLFEQDPRLSGGGKLAMPPRGGATVEDVEKQALASVRDTSLSLTGQAALKSFASFYQRYLSSFVNEGATEPASSLWGYLGDRSMKWDIVMELDPKDLRPVAAASGQVLDIPQFGTSASKVAWRENVWTIPAMRTYGLGHHVAMEFNDFVMRKYGAEVTFGEVDSPYKMLFKEEMAANPILISRDQRDLAARREAWREAGELIDPFDRINFHTKNMHRLAAYRDGDKLKPVPYCQISMDIESAQPYVTSLNYFMTPLTAEMKESFENGAVKISHLRRLFDLAEKTITDKVFEHPEFVRTRNSLREIEQSGKDPAVIFITPNSAEALDALQNVAGRDGMDKIAQDMRFAAMQYREAERKQDYEKMARMRQHIKIGLNNAYDYLEAVDKPRHFPSALALLRQEGLRKGDRDTMRRALSFAAPNELERASFAEQRTDLAPVVKIVGLRQLPRNLQDKYLDQAYQIYERTFPDSDERLSRKGFENYVKDPNRKGYDLQVALVDGEVVAGANFRVMDLGDMKMGYQSYIYTRADMQNQGIGSALFECVIETMRKQGAVAMFGEANDPRLMTSEQIEADRRFGMDPTKRLEMWARRGRYALDERYVQLGIDGGEPVSHLLINIKPIDPNFKGMSGKQYVAMLDAFFAPFIPDFKNDPIYKKLVAETKDRAFIPLIPLAQARSFIVDQERGRSSGLPDEHAAHG